MDHLQGPSDVSIITTYRCCMRCRMCDIWQNPSDIQKEIQAKELEILPSLKFVNITGGEPFVRNDLEDIVEVCFTKSPRIVISTAGYHIEEILALAERFPKIGIRVSLEGFSRINDHMRGRDGGFDRGVRTLLGLRQMGIKDIGIAMTVSETNCHELLDMHRMTTDLDMDFATATFHNSFYFHKQTNHIDLKDDVADRFFDLADELLKSRRPKDWFRAFFNVGLINYIRGNKRMLPCEAGSVNFFIEPYGDVYPCNGLEERFWKDSMGNIRDFASFADLWNGERARKVRQKVATCPKNCWMVGTAAPVMKKYLRHPLLWVAKNKSRSLLGKGVERKCLPKQYPVGQDALQGDLRGEKQFLETDDGAFPRLSSRRLATRMISVEPCGKGSYLLRVEKGDFAFNAGQYASIGTFPDCSVSRDYTFVSSPADPYLEFLIKTVPHGKISTFLEKLKVGEVVEVVGPYGDFFSSIGKYDRCLFVATGVGVGPFLSLLKARQDLDYTLVHGIRFKADLDLAADIAKSRYISCITRDEGGTIRGRVTDYILDLEIQKDTGCFLCGNPYMLKKISEILLMKGLPVSDIHTEPYYAY